MIIMKNRLRERKKNTLTHTHVRWTGSEGRSSSPTRNACPSSFSHVMSTLMFFFPGSRVPLMVPGIRAFSLTTATHFPRNPRPVILTHSQTSRRFLLPSLCLLVERIFSDDWMDVRITAFLSLSSHSKPWLHTRNMRISVPSSTHRLTDSLTHTHKKHITHTSTDGMCEDCN